MDDVCEEEGLTYTHLTARPALGSRAEFPTAHPQQVGLFFVCTPGDRSPGPQAAARADDVAHRAPRAPWLLVAYIPSTAGAT
jgi:hypothetical protein